MVTESTLITAPGVIIRGAVELLLGAAERMREAAQST